MKSKMQEEAKLDQYIQQKGYTGLDARKFVIYNDGLKREVKRQGDVFKSGSRVDKDTAPWGDVYKALQQYPVGYSGAGKEALERTRRCKQNDQYMIIEELHGEEGYYFIKKQSTGTIRNRKFFVYDDCIVNEGQAQYHLAPIGHFKDKHYIAKNMDEFSLPDTAFTLNGEPIGEAVPLSEADIQAPTLKAQISANKI